MKIIHPGMFEKTADDGTHGDILRYILDTGTQATDTANDQVNLYARLRCLVQRGDDFRVDQSVHFGDDPGFFPGRRGADFLVDIIQNAFVQRERRLQQFFQLARSSSNSYERIP